MIPPMVCFSCYFVLVIFYQLNQLSHLLIQKSSSLYFLLKFLFNNCAVLLLFSLCRACSFYSYRLRYHLLMSQDVLIQHKAKIFGQQVYGRSCLKIFFSIFIAFYCFTVLFSFSFSSVLLDGLIKLFVYFLSISALGTCDQDMPCAFKPCALEVNSNGRFMREDVESTNKNIFNTTMSMTTKLRSVVTCHKGLPLIS